MAIAASSTIDSLSLTQMQVSGMTCASCVTRVEKALKAVTGVAEVSVNLATEQATIQALTSVSADLLVKAIENAGYAAATRELIMEIEGMTCA